MASRQIPYATEQGIFLKEQGISTQETVSLNEAQVLVSGGPPRNFATFESSYVARAECPARYRRRSSVTESACRVTRQTN